jgi:DNA-binding NtrC family response regulator
LIVDDDESLRQALTRRFQQHGLVVTPAADAEEALARAAQDRCDVALLDLHLPGLSGIELLARLKERQPELEAIMLTAHGSMETAIEAMKRGAYDYLIKPFQLADLEIHIQKAFEKVQLARRERQWAQQLLYESPRYRIVGCSPTIHRVVRLIEKVAPTDATVLVRGDSGTGKELVARALHLNSPRRDRPLVIVNCAALQESLLESELFGHERGAFTGAVQTKPGLVEAAEGGTLFIDEVAEMAPGLQAKLLRVLEDGHYRRVGGTQERHADVRVLAATNKLLEQEIRAGRFREDLYYRLNVLAVELSPLRQRPEDIPELVEHFLTSRQIGPTRYRTSPEALAALQRYDWPGNVRELANVIERAQILAAIHLITAADLPETLAEARPEAGAAAGEGPRCLRAVERRHVQAVLAEVKGNKVRAARILGISRRALYRLIGKYHLEGRRPETAGAGPCAPETIQPGTSCAMPEPWRTP